MTPYEALASDMNAQVDNHLGDSLLVRPRGAPLTDDPVTVLGFLTFEGDPGAIVGADPLRRKWSVSITRDALPGGPASILKLTNLPRLGGDWYTPAADTIERSGDGWIFDLKRSA